MPGGLRFGISVLIDNQVFEIERPNGEFQNM